MRKNPPTTREAETDLPAFAGRRLRIDRRTVLRAGGVSIALPFLDAMRPRQARADQIKKRFIAFFSPNGVPMRAWSPTGGETDFKLSPILAPLEPIRQKLIVLRGIDQKAGGAGDGHQNGMTGMLTGQVTNPGPFRGGCGQGGGWANGISVDQHIANSIGKTTKFKSLELGVVTSSTDIAANFNRMSYAGPNMPLPPEENPANTFNRVFGDLSAGPVGGGTPGLADKVRAQKQTILNAVLDQYRYIKGKIGAEDGRKIEAHFQAIREIETRLSAPGAVGSPSVGTGGGVCAKPEAPPAIMNHKAYVEMPRIATLQMDMLALAFACDLSRVSTIEFSKSAGGTIMSWLGVNQSHHDISHAGDSDAAALDKLTKINNWYAQQFLHLAAKLDSYAEPGGGTILDNTVLFWCNELGKGNAHSTNDAPYVIAGSGGGYYKTGRFLQYSGTPHNNLLVSMMNAMDVPGNTFGRPDWCTGPLAKIR
jgi:hypothetical protein